MPGEMTPTTGPPPEADMLDFWQTGADEGIVRDCNCDACQERIRLLEDFRDGVSVDGNHQTISAFAGGDD